MKIKIPFLNRKKSGDRERMSTNPLQSVFFKNKLEFTPQEAELPQQDMDVGKTFTENPKKKMRLSRLKAVQVTGQREAFFRQRILEFATFE